MQQLDQVPKGWRGPVLPAIAARQIPRELRIEKQLRRYLERAGIVVPVPGSDSRWPLSGTITRSMTVVRSGPNGESTRAVEVVVTFNGTSMVSAVVNGEAIDIDLSARDGRSPLHRRDG